MRSVIASRARAFGAALVLVPLATPLLFHTRPAVRGDEKAPARALPAELANGLLLLV